MNLPEVAVVGASAAYGPRWITPRLPHVDGWHEQKGRREKCRSQINWNSKTAWTLQEKAIDKFADKPAQFSYVVRLASAYVIAQALRQVAGALDRLGNADAATPMGAIEAASVVFKESMEHLADSIGEAGLQISETVERK